MLPVLRGFVALYPVEWNQHELPYVSGQSDRREHNEWSLTTGAAGPPGTCPQMASASPPPPLLTVLLLKLSHQP